MKGQISYLPERVRNPRS